MADQKTFHICTFGCQMNVNDSLWLARALERFGFVETSLEQARVVILNTCSVREKPELKVYSALGRIAQATKKIPHSFAVVAGCVAQQIGEVFFDRFPQVHLIVGGDGLIMAPQAILQICENPELRFHYTQFSQKYPERESFLQNRKISPIAYINIMQGCDNFCTYCIVPYTRGRQKSRTITSILDECRDVLESGAKEIVLLGQNVNAFGLDKYGDQGVSFSYLLRQIGNMHGLARLRFITPHPKDFSDDVIQLFSELPVLCPRLHLPLQTGSNSILKRMHRRYDRETYLRLVEKLRKARPDLALSTDIIVGFPGETEEDFQLTMKMLDEANFMASFSFVYSSRPGTVASHFTDQIPDAIKKDRLDRLQSRQEELSTQWLQSRLERRTEILLEEPSSRNATDGKSWQGRDPWGDIVHVNLPQAEAGEIIKVKICAAKRHSLLGSSL